MKVIGVIVTYQPEVAFLKNLVVCLSQQVRHIVIVDNNSAEKIEVSGFDVRAGVGITLLNLQSNNGIAFAQNIGISKARELGGEAVLLFDQDSFPAPDMVSQLSVKLLSSGVNKVGAVGPAVIDKKNHRSKGFITGYSSFPRSRRSLPKSSSNESDDVEVPYLISSGTLIPIAVLEQVGIMKEDYFIDRVDTEWCFRAQGLGYKLLGVPSAKLFHSLGEENPAGVALFRHIHIPWHKPFRHYYVFRNTILMLKKTKMPLVWKLHSIWRLIQVGLLNLLFYKQRRMRLKFIWFGIIHGLSNVTGKLNPSGFFCEPIDSVKW